MVEETTASPAPADSAPDLHPAVPDERLLVDLDGYEGPIDVLLTLARDQKVDLKNISIAALADQYLAFVAQAGRIRLEVAADYLVMAAWLAYLKSRLLLPVPPETGDEPNPAEMAAALAFQLQRLQAMQEAGQRMMNRPLLGRDVFPRGEPEGLHTVTRAVYQLSLYELLKAYGEQRSRQQPSTLRIEATELYSMDVALERLESMLGRMPEWTVLTSFLPPGIAGGLLGRSAMAAMLTAGLEMVRSGKLQLRQEKNFGPIYVRKAPESTVTELPVDRTPR